MVVSYNGGFLKWGIVKIMAFNTKTWSNDLNMIWSTPRFRKPPVKTYKSHETGFNQHFCWQNPIKPPSTSQLRNRLTPRPQEASRPRRRGPPGRPSQPSEGKTKSTRLPVQYATGAWPEENVASNGFKGGVPQMGVPPNGWFILKDTIKMDDLGVHLSPTPPNQEISPGLARSPFEN